MKKTIAYIVIIFSLTTILIISFLSYKNIYLKRINLLSSSKTTGAVSLDDVSVRKLADLIVKLADKGDVITSKYKIYVNQNGRVQIILYSSDLRNKEEALNWLKDNGFDQIPISSIDFWDANGNKLQ